VIWAAAGKDPNRKRAIARKKRILRI
jgi:hypothetical protein